MVSLSYFVQFLAYSRQTSEKVCMLGSSTLEMILPEFLLQGAGSPGSRSLADVSCSSHMTDGKREEEEPEYCVMESKDDGGQKHAGLSDGTSCHVEYPY